MSDVPFDAATVKLHRGTTRIEASAGTGKTYTLAALFLRLVAEAGLEVGEILVTTFTIPATAELRERIRGLLARAVAMFENGPGDDALLTALWPVYREQKQTIRPRLVSALTHFDDAAISTIHGFCQRLLQERAFESGVAFDAELLADQSTLLREVADDFWRARIYPAVARLGASAMLGKLDAAKLARLLSAVVAQPTMEILPLWTADALPRAEADLLAAFAALEKAWREGAEEVRALLGRAESWAIKELRKPEIAGPALEALARCLERPASPATDYAAIAFFTQAKVDAQTAKKFGAPPQHALFAACERLGEARECWLSALRREFVHWAPAALRARKGERNLLSFDDLLLRLRDALRGAGSGALVAAARRKFTAALVDEFQDTDPVQAEIFERLFAGHGRLYFIGDPKQAIYGFRGADVFSYLRAVEDVDHRHELRINQRSVTPLVEAINAIFKEGSRSFVIEGIEFQAGRAAGRRDAEALGEEPPFQFWLWSEDKAVTAEAAQKRLPLVVADQIIAQLSVRSGAGFQPATASILTAVGEQSDTGWKPVEAGWQPAPRRLVPSNFAVLTLTNREACAVHAALTSAGLPAVVLSNGSVFKTSAADDMLALLGALARPAHEQSVRTALASTALGYDAERLATLAEDEARWNQVLERFGAAREQWLTDGFFAAFRRFLVAWGVRPRLLSQANGERSLTNLLHLAELLHAAETQHRFGPAALAQWLARQMHRDALGSEEYEQRLESDEAAVKVVTVHKSKGLEFDVVWVPYSWGKVRKDAPVTFHDAATGALTMDLGSSEMDAHRVEAERERLAEQVRLLYVALTRAKWQCHFVAGSFRECANSAAAWVLHPSLAKGGGTSSERRSGHIDDATLRSDLAALASSRPDAFAITDLPEPRGWKFTPPQTGTAPGAARVFTAAIPREWTIASFTSLTARGSADRPDHDAGSDEARLASLPPEAPLAGIHAFPRGMRAGNCLHEIFERADFAHEAGIDALVARKLEVFGFDPALHGAAVSAAVRRVLAVDLAPGLRLAGLEKSARLHEVEFHLPAGAITAKRLGSLLGEELTFSEFRGFLKGFIDLIFEKDGRFYVVDWKSNWLGSQTDDYTSAAMETEMRRHHYRVQAHLYVLALHRLLQRRVPGYQYAQHVGGVFYVFLRGIDPARPELGIFRDLPSAERIAGLDALFSRELS